MGERYRPLEVTPRGLGARRRRACCCSRRRRDEPLGVRLTRRRRRRRRGRCASRRPRAGRVEPASRAVRARPPGQRGPSSRSRSGRAARRRAPPAALGVSHVVAETARPAPRRTASSASSIAHIPIQTCLADADVRLVPRRPRDRRRRAHRLRPRRRATRSPPACAAPATTSRCSATRRCAGAAPLARFDAIVIGVRAFNTSERLRAAHAALMAYVEGGRHAGRPVQHQQPARAADGAARPLAVRDRTEAGHRRDRARSACCRRSTRR